MPKRLSIDDVRAYIESTGCKLVSTTYENNKTALDILCSCGNTEATKISYADIKRGIRCSKCRIDRMKETNKERFGYEFVSQRPEKKASACAGMLKHVSEKKYTLKEVSEIFYKAGCKLLSNTYKHQLNSLSFTCICGKEGSITLKKFLKGQRCSDKSCMNQRKEQTNIKKFGAKSYTGTDAYNDSARKTCVEKYGVEFPAQSAIVQQRIQKSGYKLKDYTLPSGIIVKLQGYEPQALTELLKTHHEDDILIGRQEQPVIWWYDAEGKKHRYFSDFFIPSENKVIEVKSTWTLNLGIESLKIPAIQAAVEEAGYMFELMVFDGTGTQTIS